MSKEATKSPSSTETAAVKKPEETQAPKKPVSLLEELRNQVVNIDKAIQANDAKSVQKTCKGMRRFKKYLKSHHFLKIWTAVYPNEAAALKFETFSDFDATFEEQFDISKKRQAKITKQSEFEVYFKVLLLNYYLHLNKVDEAYALASQLFSQVQDNSNNKKHFDQLSAFVYFYYAHTRELKGQVIEIRDQLFEAYRYACIKHNELAQATLANSILRNFLHYNQYESAQHFVSKISFPEHVSNNEAIRFLYYTGRIKTVQTDYAEAHNFLNQAIRKAPDSSALGFRIEAQKLSIIVEILLGNIPSRDIFMKPGFWNPLYPYYKVVQSVLKGNLSDFSNVLNQFKAQFVKDKNYALVQRLIQTVIKTGLKKINLSYSRISFADIAAKLNLNNDSNVESVVAKAIRDGILNAKIDHQNQYITIKLDNDVYNTNLPQQAFSQRIAYCMNLYNQATKALQYPDTNTKNQNKNDENNGEDEDDDDEDIDVFKLMDEED